MPNAQEITRRLKSIKSTKKITKAMQMVSAAKMRKAQNATFSSRDYASLASNLIKEISGVAKSKHPLLITPEDAKKHLAIIISTNRGLVGSFNSNLFVELNKYNLANKVLNQDIFVIGKKARETSGRKGLSIKADFLKHDTTIPISEIYPVAKMITDHFKTGEYKEVVLIYNHFVSTLVQVPTIKTLLPFHQTNGSETHNNEPLFEQNPSDILNHLIPRILESQIYQAILESDASEHSARMVMMKNATEAAADLISDLTLTFNQLRQNKITTELSEITAGKIALENS